MSSALVGGHRHSPQAELSQRPSARRLGESLGLGSAPLPRQSAHRRISRSQPAPPVTGSTLQRAGKHTAHSQMTWPAASCGLLGSLLLLPPGNVPSVAVKRTKGNGRNCWESNRSSVKNGRKAGRGLTKAGVRVGLNEKTALQLANVYRVRSGPNSVDRH